MRVAYLGSLEISDSEFPLIRALQNKGADVLFYIPIGGKSTSAGILTINKVKKKNGIIPASEYEEFNQLHEYFDISRIYIINNYNNSVYDIRSWLIWLKFIMHVKRKKANILHFVWPFWQQKGLLFFFKIAKVMTVHDPIRHSGQESRKDEKLRKKCFDVSKKLLLLSNTQTEEFAKRYNLDRKKIVISRFGYYDWIDELFKKSILSPPSPDYILFCGQIQSHKGVDVLLKAMLEVHKHNPNLSCVIAGKGTFYFDVTPYQNLEYVEFRNYFISMKEMIGLIKGSMFVVCPYKDATQSGIVQMSLSSDKPLIVTNVGALPYAVKDGEYGIVVPPSDVNALADAILRLANDTNMLNRFCNNIRSNWKTAMSWGPVVDDYIALYQ